MIRKAFSDMLFPIRALDIFNILVVKLET